MQLHQHNRNPTLARSVWRAQSVFLLAVTGACLLIPTIATATDTAFWKPYAPDEHTYALSHFDAPASLSGKGKLEGAGQWVGDAAREPEGRFGGGLRVGSGGPVRFPTKPFDPNAMALHEANRTLSLEGWVRLDKYPAAGEKAYILFRPSNEAKAIGFSLFVTSEGALGTSLTPRGSRRPTVHASPADAVPLGEWTHVAGVFASGHLSVGRDRLFVNGATVADFPASDAVGAEADLSPAPIHVGGAGDYGMAFGLRGAKDLSDDRGLEIDHVILRHTSRDPD